MHNFWELVYVTEGSVFVSEDSRVYELSEGDIIFHKPMEFHQINADEPGLEIFICSFKMSGELTYKFKRAVFELVPEEINLFEKLNIFDGYYHVLDGLISPIDGINPEDINIVNEIINGNTYIAEDTGSAIKGKKIDIYYDSHSSALAWGRRSIDVYLAQ